MRDVVVFVLAIVCACAARPRVERADQLPVHRYPIEGGVGGKVGRMVVDGAAFAPLGRVLRADVERDLADYDIRDRKSLKDRWFTLALLDALDGRWTDAVAELDRIAAIEVDPADRAMTGLTIRVWSDALAAGGTPAAFEAALDRRVRAMPLELVRNHLSVLRTMGQVFTPEVCRGLVDDAIGGHLEGGALSLDQAQAVAFQRYAAVHLAPVGAAIDRVLGGLGVAAQQ